MTEGVPPRFWNVPNTLTLSRLGLAVIVFALISYKFYFSAVVVFSIAALTDALDGYFARLLNQESPIGRQLDPLIDKVIVAGTYIYLLTVGIHETGVYPWMVTTIVVRELLIQGLRSLLEGQGHPFGARMAGKLKTLFQCLSIIAILLCLWKPTSSPWLLGRDLLTWVAVGLTVYSGIGYIVVALPVSAAGLFRESFMEWFESLVLGLVQGLTEFLPVSSDGHLSITQQIFARVSGRSHTGAENLFFDVMLHLGTLAAIVVYYRAVVWTGLRGLLGSNEVPPSYRRHATIRTGLLAGVATLPLVPDALFLKDFLEKTFESTAAAGVGFLITAAVLAVTIWLPGGEKGPAETTWRDALLIGIAQMFAPLPGVSRSGLTVATALALGLSRTWAVGFSLLMAVPAILGAVVFELRKVDPALLTADRVTRTVAATVLAGLVGYGAIIWLVKIVRSGRLWCFSVYLLILGAVVLAAAAFWGGA